VGTEDESLQTDRGLALRLRRTWSAFFDKHGRLTEIQRRAIPVILEGGDALLCSPTASGKTEAAVVPIIEAHWQAGRRWTLLIVSPTRALVNDLYRRLEPKCHSLGLPIARRTGDYRPSGDHPPAILITTPESLDSMLCRNRTSDGRHYLAWVTAVVLDEIHIVQNSPRGEQIRWLMARLRRLRRFARRKGWCETDRVQATALSATLSDPNEVCRRFLGPDAQPVTCGGHREIVEEPPSPPISPTEEALPNYLRSTGTREKVLVFCNSRRRVDELSVDLRKRVKDLGYEVEAHHGSLEKRVREHAEKVLQEASAAILVSTSTLEIGVDIGDIDLVVLDEPAPDVAALLQRIGRGNRRSGQTRVMAVAQRRDLQVIHAAMLKAASTGWLGPVESGPHYSVAAQQIASFVFQSPRRTRSRDRLASLVSTCMNAADGESLVLHMIAEGEIEPDPAGVRLGEDLRDAAALGSIHSNIESPAGLSVVDSASGERIATGVAFGDGRSIKVGGHQRQVRGVSRRTIEVRTTKGGSQDHGTWGYQARSGMVGSSQPQCVRRYLGYSDAEWPGIETDAGWVFFHFGGVRRRAVIQLAQAAHCTKPLEEFTAITGWFVICDAPQPPKWLLSAKPGLVEIGISSEFERLEGTLARPWANKKLPDDLRIKEVQEWLTLSPELSRVQAAEWTTSVPKETADVLELLVG